MKADGLDCAGRPAPAASAVDADGEVLAGLDSPGPTWPGWTPASIDALLASAKAAACRRRSTKPPAWNYTWDLVLANPQQLVDDFRGRRPQRHRGQGRGALRHPRQPRRRVRRPRRPGASDGRDRRRARADLHRRRRRDPSLHPDRRALLYRQEVDPAGGEVPRRQLDRPHVPRRRRGRGVDHPRLLEQVPRRLPRPRLRRPMGQPRGPDHQ